MVPYRVRRAVQLAVHAANVTRDRLGMATRATVRRVRRLRSAAARAADWPYSSGSLRLHGAAARRHFRAAEMRVHGGAAVAPCEVVRVALDESVPPLAWIARSAPSGWTLTVGRGVETSGHGVFEGAWAGPFSEFRPDLCAYAFGSGAVWADGTVVFVPPRHLEECLFVLHRASDGLTLVGNSLAFLLVEAGLTTSDPFFEMVAARIKRHAFEQCRRGVDRVWPIVARDDDHTLYQCSYFNFSVDAEGRPHRDWRAPCREFETYSEYVELLTRTTAAVFGNGGDPARKRPLAPAVALSSGYDSPAAAVIARRAGCTRAVTLATTVDGHHDSGVRIGTALGLGAAERTHVLGDRIDTLDLDSGDHLLAQAAEFIATFGIGDDVAFLPFENDLPASVLVTGVWGDSIWARAADVTSGLPVRILFGKSLGEYRLRVGFAHLPLPFVGARYAEPVRRLSRSAEMRAYRTGGEYDRPVPRRIAEEAGVPREWFGIRKAATAPWLKDHDALFPQAMAVVMARYRRPAH